MTTTEYSFDLYEMVFAEVDRISWKIINNYGLAKCREDILQETRTILLEWNKLYDFDEKCKNKSYQDTAVRNAVIKACEKYSDPAVYYYQPEWLRENLSRLIDGAKSETDAIEVTDFQSALSCLTDIQRDSIIDYQGTAADRANAGRAIKKLARAMNKSAGERL